MRHVRPFSVAAVLVATLVVPAVVRAQSARSGNPILPGWYADPEAHVFDGQYWIYPTYSAPYGQQTFLDAFSSRDLITWVKHPHVLDTANVRWAKRAVWAPSIVEKDGWYYLFFGANDIQNDQQVGGIGVARARTPGGPFVDYIGKPLIGQFHNGAQPIDMMVFKDRDGTYYIVYGGWGHCNIAKLNADFTGLVPLPDGSMFKEITPKGYVEGVFMLIRGDRYYLMWSEGGWTGPDYAVAYAIGSSPFGPFERIGKILQQDSTVATGAGHHSVLQSPASGKWYIVYHRRPLGETDRNHRVVSIDEMHFDSRGFILPVKITKEGVPADPLPPSPSAPHGSTSHPPLDSAAIDDIATLLKLEDTRTFDSLTIGALVASQNPEVRRRAILAVAHINDKRGIALLRGRPLDTDTAIAATTVFAVGQLRDTLTIPWLDSLLSSPATPPTVLSEAACALGKIKTAAAREVLARFLAGAVAGARINAAIGEALLSIGRSTARGNRDALDPILKWTTSRDEAIRWRATWALFRPRDPAAVKPLLSLATDPSAEVRTWAVRALAKPQADSASLAPQALALLLAATRDPDRAVRTEAVRALATYPDSSAVAALVHALSSTDSWISVSAAEGLARPRASWTVPALVSATRSTNGCALRVTAMRSLQSFAPGEARAAATALGGDSIPYCRNAAAQLLRDTIPGGGRAGGGRGGRRAPAPVVPRSMDEYRAIVERWIVPAYTSRPLPRAEWQTTRGTIELELYAADAPLAMDAFARIMSAGTIVGTEFTRVVPDFVDQQATIRDAAVQRDEVNRHRLTRGNLAWASSGLDTGRPGYTLNHTPQPHNEGDFTSLGRVVAGQDVVDRIQLGDRIVAAKMLEQR